MHACRTVFQNGKVLPIDRAGGIDQPIMHLVAEKAAQGDWVHVFPEAKIGYSGRLQPLKRGIGKLVCDSLREGKPYVFPSFSPAANDEVSYLPSCCRIVVLQGNCY